MLEHEENNTSDKPVLSYCSDSESDDTSQTEPNESIETNDEDKLLGSHLDSLTVIGIYRRGSYPENVTEKELRPDQIMPRQRLKTRPLGHKGIEDINGDDNEETYDDARFEPVTGLVNNSFWHIRPNEAGLYADRAVLFQAVEHYDKLVQQPQFSYCFDDYLNTPYFGEQIIVKGYDSSQLAIGDVFEVADSLSPLVVEISSPRKPCYYVDKRNKTSKGQKGMKRHTLTEGLAGWFTKVLVAGELRDGMKLVRTKHPHPKWTLTYVSKVLFTEGSKIDFSTCRARWNREKSELVELLNLPQLGEYEWKQDARQLLAEIEKKEAEENVSTFSFLWGSSNTSYPELKLTVRGIYGRGYDIKEGEIERHRLMARERYEISALNEPEKEGEYIPVFAPTRGLCYEDFWHADQDAIAENRVYGDRAILFQSIEHYKTLSQDPKFAPCFDNGDYDYMEAPTFGEQVIIEGCDSTQIAVGDVFEVEGRLSKLMVEVSSPRKPGDFVDKNHHGKSMGEDGILWHCLRYGLSGWFTRVLVAGPLRDGMKLIRTKHPNPKWTLAYISNAMYGRGVTAQWSQEDQELIEMINLPQLGEFEWKQEGIKLLNNMDSNSVDKSVDRVEEAESQGYFSSFISFATGASLCYCEGMENLAGCGLSSSYYYE